MGRAYQLGAWPSPHQPGLPLGCSDLCVWPWGVRHCSPGLQDELLQVTLTELPVQLLKLLSLGLGHTGPSETNSQIHQVGGNWRRVHWAHLQGMLGSL